MKKLNLLFAFALFLLTLTVSSSASAALGHAVDWQLNLQEPASPVMEKLTEFHDMLLYVIFTISILVCAVLLYICVRFSEKNNPKPSKFTHHAVLEFVWTFIPVVILFYIGIFSIRALEYMDKTYEADMTIKAVGYQWYWGYEYPDENGLSFESRMIPDEDIKEGQLRLLEVDERVVVPVNKNVRLLTTGADVIHAWAVPALGVKIDSVPGRTNETWFRVTKEGVYRGQCSELCGIDHGFMPIVVEAVSEEKYKEWLAKAKNRF